MTATNTMTHFGWVTKTFHWLTALLIIAAIVLGVLAHDAPFETSSQLTRKAWLFSFHKTIGITAFFVAVLRVAWAFTQPRPAKLNGDKRLEVFLAETVHWALYASMIVVPLAGWITHAASEGFAPIWWPFGQSFPLIPKSAELSVIAGQVHMAWEKILVVSIALHILGALKHHFIDKDATLKRMLPGRPAVSVSPKAGSFIAPIVALAVFIAVGGVAYMRADIGSPTSQVALATPVETNYRKDGGSLEIVIQQFGSEVRGEFADWSAAIEFDETIRDGQAGTVEGQIAIGSLTLGSVTAQAMGADFFDAEQFPVASYQGNIIANGTDYILIGDLTLKGITQPFEMPFDLSLQGMDVQAIGEFDLARLDFGVGASSQPNGDNLGLAVKVFVTFNGSRDRK